MSKGNALLVGSESGPDFELLVADANFHVVGGHLHYPAGLSSGGPFCPSVSPLDGDLYVWSNTGDLLRYDADTLDLEATIDTGLKGLNFVFDAAGHVVIASSNCDIARIETSNGTLESFVSNSSNFSCPFIVLGVQWAPPPRRELCVLVENGEFDLFEHAILRFDADTGQTLAPLIPFSNPADPHQLNWESSYFCFGPDGNVYAPNMNRDVNRFDGVTGQFLDTFLGGAQIPSYVRHLLFTPDGSRLYVTVAGQVLEFDVATRTRTKSFPLGTATPAFCAWISSEWVEKQLIAGLVSQLPPAKRPTPTIPKIEYKLPNFPVNPLGVLSEILRRASSGDPSRATDAVARYGLRRLAGMLSDPQAAGSIHRALTAAFGDTEVEDLRARLAELRGPAAGR